MVLCVATIVKNFQSLLEFIKFYRFVDILANLPFM